MRTGDFHGFPAVRPPVPVPRTDCDRHVPVVDHWIRGAGAGSAVGVVVGGYRSRDYCAGQLGDK
jgi:hypothetical protein